MSKKSRQRAHQRKLGVAVDEGAAPAAVPAAVPAAAPALSKAAKRNAQKKRAAKAKRAAQPQEPRKPARASSSSLAVAPSGLAVVHEDEHVVAINKPAGLLCHPSPGFWEHGTVVHELAARQRLASFSPIPAEMLGERQSHTGEADSVIPRAIVHRLDRGTTGLMLVAKTPLAEAHLTEQFKGRTTRKRYVALLHGRLRAGAERASCQPGELRIDAPIGRDPERPGKMLAHSPLGGKPAQSVVHVHAYCAVRRVCLVSIDLLTGRQHQIRVHCAHRGAAVANDEAYDADVATFRQSFGLLPRARPLLHAWSMEVPHPRGGGATLRAQAPLPTDVLAVVGRLWPQLSAEPATWPRVSFEQMDEADAALGSGGPIAPSRPKDRAASSAKQKADEVARGKKRRSRPGTDT